MRDQTRSLGNISDEIGQTEESEDFETVSDATSANKSWFQNRDDKRSLMSLKSTSVDPKRRGSHLEARPSIVKQIKDEKERMNYLKFILAKPPPPNSTGVMIMKQETAQKFLKT